MKSLKTCVFTAAIFMACSCAAFADGNAFTPLNFDDIAYGTPAKVSSSSSIQATEQTPAGNTKMQSAITQLDNAQVDVRNELLNYKSKYSDVDAQYKAVKAERKALEKQIKQIEKRIKQIDNAKEKIRKNMM